MKDKDLARKDLAAGILGLLIGAFFLYFSKDIVLKNGNPATDSMFMPRVIGILLVAVSLLHLLTCGCIKALKEAAPTQKDPAVKLSLAYIFEEYSDWISMAVLLLYAALFKPLGYIVSSCIYMLLQIPILATAKERKVLLIALISLALPVAVYFLFTYAFHLRLPSGILRF